MEALTQKRPAAPAASATPQPARHRAPLTGGEYLSCRLGDEEYGIEILRVQEIRSYELPMRMAGACWAWSTCAASSRRCWTCA